MANTFQDIDPSCLIVMGTVPNIGNVNMAAPPAVDTVEVTDGQFSAATDVEWVKSGTNALTFSGTLM